MQFSPPLISAKLIKRYKRFLADVEFSDGTQITVHVPNSGSMLGVNKPGSPCLLSVSNTPSRKLKHTLETVKVGATWVGVNTANTNKLVNEAFNSGVIPHWRDFTELKSEVKINDASRLDFLLSSPHHKRQRYVEVKNVSMASPPWAEFPDAVTERGQKHLNELMTLVHRGFEAELFFVVQRNDCSKFRPADQIDPLYGKLLREAQMSGVVISCWQCVVGPSEIHISHPLSVEL